ncbi:MAG: restriction endonuclease subunit S [Spirochaetota bacterium]
MGSKQLGDVTDIVSGGTPSTNRKEFWDGDIYWCTPTDITALYGSKYLIDTARKISLLGLKNCSAEILPENSIVMTTRATIGECAINKIPVSTNQGFKSFIPKGINAEFLYYKLLTQKSKFVQLGSGSTFFEVSKKDITDFLIDIPPTKAEQTAIAAALSDADALISSLEKLIAKKRNIKQGAMQELLTGKKRLQGFDQKKGYKQSEVGVIPKDWRVKPLGELFTFSGVFSATRDQLSDNGFCYLHYGDIHNSKKTFIDVSEEYQEIPKLKIPLKSVSAKSLLNEGDIVFVDASEDDEGASKHIVVRNRKCIVYISGLHTIVAKSKDESLDNLYKQFCFQTVNVKKQFKFFAVGTKVTGISKTNITKIHIPLPQKPEQTAIAKILTDMDAEIEALEKKLAKYRRIKQGMMQELLTGKTRLV